MLPFSRFEARTILKLSGPIVLAQLTQTLMYFVDTVMAGRVSATDLAAVAVGASVWVPLFLFMAGVLMSGTVYAVSRRGWPPLASMAYTCALPERDSVATTWRPSGDQEGALLEPRKLASRRLFPVATSCE